MHNIIHVHVHVFLNKFNRKCCEICNLKCHERCNLHLKVALEIAAAVAQKLWLKLGIKLHSYMYLFYPSSLGPGSARNWEISVTQSSRFFLHPLALALDTAMLSNTRLHSQHYSLKLACQNYAYTYNKFSCHAVATISMHYITVSMVTTTRKYAW